MRLSKVAGLFACIVVAGGCHSGFVPDPNVAPRGGAVRIESLYSTLEGYSYYLNQRQEKGQIGVPGYKQLLLDWSSKLSAQVQPDKVAPERAWMAAQIYRTAHKWPEAEKMFQAAVKWATETSNPDRRVNDLLRLAQVQAEQGKVTEAIACARKTFDAKPIEAAPILVSVLLELIPSAQGKKHDQELAELLEAAMQIEVKVDAQSDAGKSFLRARPYHLNRAYMKARDLRSASVKI